MLLSKLKAGNFILEYSMKVDVLSMDQTLEICTKHAFGNGKQMKELVSIVKGMFYTHAWK